jgi:type I restriction enzyme, S subunit
MESVRERPDTFFRLSPAGAKPESYALRRGELEGRFSAEYYRTEFRELFTRLRTEFPGIKGLGNYAEIVCGPFGTEITLSDYVADGVPLLRISNITDEGGLDLSEVKYIAPEKSRRLSTTRVTAGDMVISQRGTLGMPAVISSEAPIFNISANLIAIRKISDLRPEFIQLFLASRLGERQIARLQSGQVHPKITTDDVASVLIPNVPHARQLVAAMGAARAARRAKIVEAEALLAGLDNFLLTTLGLDPPPKCDRKVFAATLTEARQQFHLNADYFHPERVLALRAMEAASYRVPCTKLADVVSFIRDQIKMPGPNYLSLAHVQSNTGELVNADEEATGACSQFQTGDVLFARLRPYLNKVYRAETYGCCSPEFHVLRVHNVRGLLPDYLAAILRSSLTLAQTRHMMTGNTHPRLTNEDVTNLVVPIPKDVAVQETIAAEARRRRDEARRLRTEAESGWQAAKRWFETQLLGPAKL